MNGIPFKGVTNDEGLNFYQDSFEFMTTATHIVTVMKMLYVKKEIGCDGFYSELIKLADYEWYTIQRSH